MLVTSQKEQALAVLHEMVPPQVRDLCVMLAAGDNSGSGALERTLTALSDHAATVHQEQLEASIRDLQQRRMLLLRQRAELEEDIRRLRETETIVHEPAPGYRGTLVELTYLVAQGEQRHRWMPTPAPDAPGDFPLGVGLFSQLRDLLRTMSPERVARTRQWFPDSAAVPDAEGFAERIARIKAGAAATSVLDPIGEAVAHLSVNALERIEHLVQDAANCLHHLGLGPSATQWQRGDWRIRALANALSRRNARQWERIAASAIAAQKNLDAALGLESVDISRLHPQEYATLANAARAWRDHLESGQQPRKLFPPEVQVRVKPLLARCTISGSPPVTVEDLNRVITVLEAATTAEEIDALWRGVKVRAESAPLAERLERQAARAGALGHVVRFGTLRDEIDRELLAHGVRILLGTEAEWDAFITAIASARARIHLAAEVQALDDLSETLTSRGTDTPAPEVEALRAAVRARDSTAYATAYQRFSIAQQERADQATLKRLFAEINAAHPKLARTLAEDPDNARWDDPADVAQAWAWAVAAAFCEHHRAHGRDQQLGDELAATESRLLTVTGDLAGAHGWLHFLTRLDERQRRALAHLRSHLTAVGSGEGRYADRSRAAVRGAMTTARDAVPAWIMPLHQVVENLPAEPDSFDVVIVDEASQVGLDGLFLLWLAPRMIVVGDNKQCVPGYSGDVQQKLFDRIDEYLPDLPLEERHMFRPEMNLYELLSARFPKVVRLTEHFRSMPEIIGWSSEQFYNRSLVPLRRFGADRLDPLQVRFVHGAYQEGRQDKIHNPIEAKEIVDKLQEMVDDPRYERRSFGIITLQGSEQARRIERLIAQTLPPPILEKHKIRVGKPADFQGDERDVILLSMVVVTPGKIFKRLDDQRRFNVAASRARDQMWLFTSVAPDRLKQDDLRTSLLTYMAAPPSTAEFQAAVDVSDVRADSPHPAFDSLFEQRVYLRIHERGYALVPQVPVGAKRIDLVVYGSRGQLAVECDGDHWHNSAEQQRADIRRERELVRAGWQFWRVRESDFAHDPDAALAPLWTALAARGIEPGTHLPPHHAETLQAPSWTPIELPSSDQEDDTGETEEDEEDIAS